MGTASSLKSDECESESNTTKFSLQKSPAVGIRHRMFVHFIRLSRSAVASRIRGLGFDPERGEFRMFVVGAFQNVWRKYGSRSLRLPSVHKEFKQTSTLRPCAVRRDERERFISFRRQAMSSRIERRYQTPGKIIFYKLRKSSRGVSGCRTCCCSRPAPPPAPDK